MMREVNLIVIHCSATKPNMDIGVAEIDQWHKDRGWDSCGYHYVIRRDGSVEKGRKESQPGAHAYGHNASSIGICLVGGIDEHGQSQNNYMPAQFSALRDLLQTTKLRHSNASVVGHTDLNPKKDCPCFDVKEWLQSPDPEQDINDVYSVPCPHCGNSLRLEKTHENIS